MVQVAIARIQAALKAAWPWIQFLFAALFIIVVIAGRFAEDSHTPRVGDSCGDGHHWVHTGLPDPYGDISCEADR